VLDGQPQAGHNTGISEFRRRNLRFPRAVLFVQILAHCARRAGRALSLSPRGTALAGAFGRHKVAGQCLCKAMRPTSGML